MVAMGAAQHLFLTASRPLLPTQSSRLLMTLLVVGYVLVASSGGAEELNLLTGEQLDLRPTLERQLVATAPLPSRSPESLAMPLGRQLTGVAASPEPLPSTSWMWTVEDGS
jgi:hypothetical protein